MYEQGVAIKNSVEEILCALKKASIQNNCVNIVAANPNQYGKWALFFFLFLTTFSRSFAIDWQKQRQISCSAHRLCNDRWSHWWCYTCVTLSCLTWQRQHLMNSNLEVCKWKARWNSIDETVELDLLEVPVYYTYMTQKIYVINLSNNVTTYC